MKRFTFYHFRSIIIFLLIAGLFHGCAVYHKESIPIEQAIGNHKQGVKIVMNSGQKYIFNSLYFEGELLYGILRNPKVGQAIKLQINTGSIDEIHLYNKSATYIVSIVCTVATIGMLIAILALSIDYGTML